jgi:hypothetical protein
MSFTAAPSATRARLMKLRDEFVALSSQGRYTDAASREWSELPMEWRIVLMMLAGVPGARVDNALRELSQRSWNELPPAEREALRAVVRVGVPRVSRLRALAARV